jgi:uncharacterized protein
MDKLNEDQWFSENEQEMIKAAKARHEHAKKEKTNQEEQELKDLHWLKCPKCGSDMKEIQIEEIEVDQCSKCDGVFFDAGELDQLMLSANEKKKSIFRKLLNPLF